MPHHCLLKNLGVWNISENAFQHIANVIFRFYIFKRVGAKSKTQYTFPWKFTSINALCNNSAEERLQVPVLLSWSILVKFLWFLVPTVPRILTCLQVKFMPHILLALSLQHSNVKCHSLQPSTIYPATKYRWGRVLKGFHRDTEINLKINMYFKLHLVVIFLCIFLGQVGLKSQIPAKDWFFFFNPNWKQ